MLGASKSLRLLNRLGLLPARVSVPEQDPWRISRESSGQADVVTGSDSPEHWIAVHKMLQVCSSVMKLFITQCWASGKAASLNSCGLLYACWEGSLLSAALCASAIVHASMWREECPHALLAASVSLTGPCAGQR